MTGFNTANNNGATVGILNEEKKSITKKGLNEYKKFKNYTEFNNYKKVFQLHSEGLSYKEISRDMGWLASEDYKVGTYLSKFKKAIEEANLF